MSSIVIALDSFKGSISATAASAAVADGWRSVDPSADTVLRPMADGGEGTLDAFAAGVEGARRMPVSVRGPHGRDVAANWLLLHDGTGVVELASTSGIELLNGTLRPWDADSYGFGQAIAAALDHGVRRLVLGIGSSASTDAGVGMLQALGARSVDAQGTAVAPGAAGVRHIAHIDLTALRPPPAGGVLVLSDVTSPLLGPTGAAAVFGPQKGFAARELADVDAALARLAQLVPADPAAPGAGAAGGTGFGLAAWGAQLIPGAVKVAELIGLDAAVAHARCVITGEGSYDGQSAAGKVPSLVAHTAARHRVPALLLTGRIAAEADLTPFDRALSLTVEAGGTEAALSNPAHWLRLAGRTLAQASRTSGAAAVRELSQDD